MPWPCQRSTCAPTLPSGVSDLRAGIARGVARRRRRLDLILGCFRHAGLECKPTLVRLNIWQHFAVCRASKKAERRSPFILLPMLTRDAGTALLLWLTTTEGQPCTDGNGIQHQSQGLLQGLQGKAVADLCNEYQISQSLYYQSRDQFLAQAGQVFEVHQHGRRSCTPDAEVLEYLKALV